MMLLFQIRLLILISLFIASVNSLQLAPVIVHQPIKHEFNFVANVPTADVIMSQLQVNTYGTAVSTIQSDMLHTMAKEISLAIGLDTKIHHMKWEFSISPQIGSLKIFNIVADIKDKNINVSGKMLHFEQQIPKLYENKQHCAHTGRRRYGIAGPRRVQCHTYQIERGLHADEINIVNQALQNKAVESRHLLN